MITASVAGSALAGGLVGFFDCKFYGGIGHLWAHLMVKLHRAANSFLFTDNEIPQITLTARLAGLWRKPVVEQTNRRQIESTDAAIENRLASKLTGEYENVSCGPCIHTGITDLQTNP